MHTSRPRRVAAILAVLAVLLAVLPAAAAPPKTDRPVASEPSVRVPLVHALAAWLAALWLGSDPPSAPQSVWEEIGADLDPGGAPQPASSVPTATPQLGPGAGPLG